MNDSDFIPGFIVGLAIGLIIVIIIVSGNSSTHEKELVERGFAEYRIDAKTGQSSFHMFRVESGKVVN